MNRLLSRLLIPMTFVACASAWAACPVTPAEKGPVSYYGRLLTTNLGAPNPMIYGETSNRRAQVRGLSFGWSNTGWGSNDFFNANAVNHMVDDWKAEVVRAPLGIGDSSWGSYTYLNAAGEMPYAAENKARVVTVVEAAIAKDVFVIIDWHSHNAQKETELSKAFFTEMAQTYGECPHVIFELYNEPTGVSWPAIKEYAEAVIPAIREYSQNLILVGTPSYSQRVDQAAANPINAKNIGYVLHFYADTHPLSAWKENILTALETVPLFVTEYGTTNADGGSCTDADNDGECDAKSNYWSHNDQNSDEWMDFLDSKKISSAAWNFNDKAEASAFFGLKQNFRFDQTVDANWSNLEMMTASGQYVFKRLNQYRETAPWDPTPILGGVDSPLPQGRAQYFDMCGNKLEGAPQVPGVYVARQGGVSRSVVVK